MKAIRWTRHERKGDRPRFLRETWSVPFPRAEDAELVQAVFRSALEFVERVPVRRLTFVPDARMWELIR